MAFPFSDTYVLSEQYERSALRADVEGAGPSDDRGLGLGRWVPEGPIALVRHSGSTPLDLVGTTWVAIKLVSKRLVDLLTTHGITGWSSYPVRLSGKDGKPVPGYAGFAVRGWCGPIDDSRSIVTEEVGKGGTVPVWRGLFFDPATWDGSDIFAPEGTVHLMVVGKVKRLLEEHGITNVRFRPLVDIERYEAHVEASKRIYAEWRSRNN